MMNYFSNPIVLWIGAIIPAILSIFFIINFDVSTVFWDEWHIVPYLSVIFGGGDIFSLDLTSSHNEHIPLFPRLIILSFAGLSFYEIFLGKIVGWIFLSMIVIVLWFLLSKTFPEAKWLIIPISWISYSVVQYPVLLQGWASIHWYSTLFFVVLAFYFLNNARESKKSLVSFVALSFIATFSHLIGFVTWLIGLNYLKIIEKRYFVIIPIFLVLAVFSYLLLFSEGAYYDRVEVNTGEPIDLVKYNFLFLANSFRISTDLDVQVQASLGVGIILFSIFVSMMLLAHFKIKDQQLITNIRPWFDLCLFVLFASIITSIGRIHFGVQQALTNRYVPVSNLFLEGLSVITVVIILYVIKNEKQPKRKKIEKVILAIFLILLSLYVADGYIGGWIGVSAYHDRVSEGYDCLLDYQSSSDDCLEILHPNVEILKSRAKILEDLCLGPFKSDC